MKEVPVSFGTPMRAIRAISLSLATLLINVFSTRFTTPFTLVPGLPVKLESTSRFTLNFLAISTDRLWSTWAPNVANSSISL